MSETYRKAEIEARLIYMSGLKDDREPLTNVDEVAIGIIAKSLEEIVQQAQAEARKEALEECLQLLPGGEYCDPQHIADDIRELMMKEAKR